MKNKKKIALSILTILLAHTRSLIAHNKPFWVKSGFRADTHHFGIPTMQLDATNYQITLDAILEEMGVDYGKAMLYAAYFPADNNLRMFLIDNLKGMAKVGSNENLIIVVHLDIKISWNKKVTRWYLVLKDKLIQLNTHMPDIQAMDSGDPKTLLTFIEFCAKQFPAKHVAIELADHGSGSIDPNTGWLMRPHERFVYNPTTKLLELDRSESFLDAVNQQERELRGMCWDDSTGHYLNNHDLLYCFREIKERIYKGKKPDLYVLNACFMAMLEVASLLKDYGDILVASEEAVYAPGGWSYQKLFFPFLNQPLSPKEFAQHALNMHRVYYQGLTEDYAFSAIDLSAVKAIEDNLDRLSGLLIQLLDSKHREYVKNAIYQSKSKNHCTRFEEKSYKDLDNFLEALLLEFEQIKSITDEFELSRKAILTIIDTREALHAAIFANIVGKRLSRAQGLSIYFPERKMHSSYGNSPFGRENGWYKFLQRYLIP